MSRHARSMVIYPVSVKLTSEMTTLFGVKLVGFGLQLSVIGALIQEWRPLVYIGVLVSVLGFLVDSY
jgi:hypothetical protein